ncbi:small-subunit processome [Pseudomassariella vexata]|uniref:U3 small nucleolar RNA-associated protein 11 n=1 Tax=Pseudomassariella vexata TaxID=1141098 RepID=A0A1Y2DDP2_9PEZI|nr:small-subunit processome [Pseudomassariella vexata]ORY57224.1 small-subunit processome [Pseudomassariella vexata]
MSSMRNAVHRRNHKERAQPKERQKLGLLEKHKDYSLRAADFNKKKKQLKNLREKAANRNEDEFFFGMLSRSGVGKWNSKGRRWTGTVDGDRGNRALDQDVVRLMKTQDINYVRTVRNVATKEVKGLEERVVNLGGSLDGGGLQNEEEDDEWEDDDMPAKKKPKKIVFAEAVSEREERIQTELDREIEDEDTANKEAEQNPEALRAEQRQRLLMKLQRRLQLARKKVTTLSTAENELELQRAKMAKTATVGVVTKTGKKFKVRERKR